MMYQSGDHRDPPGPTAETWRRQTVFGNRVDIGDRLPVPARDKLEALRAELRDATALATDAYTRLKENRDDRLAIEARIGDLSQRDNLAPSHPLIEAERSSLAKFLAESRRISDEHAARKAVADIHRVLISRLEAYVAKLPAAITLAPVTSPKLDKGETALDAVNRLRKQLDELCADLQSALDAPISSTDAKVIARKHVESLAAQGVPNTLCTLEGRRPPRFASRRGGPVVGHGGDGQQTFVGSADDGIDTASTLAWLHKDAIIAALEREIDRNADDRSALSDEQRAAKIASCKVEILKIERMEESFITMAALAGQRIARRADPDPRALLSLADVMPSGDD